jgi:hypothetical protein
MGPSLVGELPSETFAWAHAPSLLMALNGPIELPSKIFARAHALPLPMTFNGPIAGGRAAERDLCMGPCPIATDDIEWAHSWWVSC